MDLRISGDRTEQSHNMKLLGTNIDSQLKFSTQVSEVNRRTSQQIGVLGRLRNLIPVHDKLQSYKAAILPHLTYCRTNGKLNDYRRQLLE